MDLESFADECVRLIGDGGSKEEFKKVGADIQSKGEEPQQFHAQIVAKSYQIGKENGSMFPMDPEEGCQYQGLVYD